VRKTHENFVFHNIALVFFFKKVDKSIYFPLKKVNLELSNLFSSQTDSNIVRESNNSKG